MIGRFAEGITLIDETIRRVETNGDASFMPELPGVKGGLLLSMPQPRIDDAEMYLMQSLELSRRQGAHGSRAPRSIWQRCLPIRAEARAAGALLRPVFEQFVEGLDTADLKAAERVLATLG